MRNLSVFFSRPHVSFHLDFLFLNLSLALSISNINCLIIKYSISYVRILNFALLSSSQTVIGQFSIKNILSTLNIYDFAERLKQQKKAKKLKITNVHAKLKFFILLLRYHLFLRYLHHQRNISSAPYTVLSFPLSFLTKNKQKRLKPQPDLPVKFCKLLKAICKCERVNTRRDMTTTNQNFQAFSNLKINWKGFENHIKHLKQPGNEY